MTGQFEIADVRYTDPRFMMGDLDDFGAIDYSGIRISDLVSQHSSKLRMGYEYDFGDGWRHEVVLEKASQSEPGAKYSESPRVPGSPGAERPV